MELLLFVLAISIWASVYWPVYLVMRLVFGSEAKAKAFAVFWPITMPLGLLLLAMLRD